MNVDPATFADNYWSRRALLSPAVTLPQDFTDLLDLAGIDELLSRRGIRTPFLRVAKAGTIRPTSSYTRGGGAGADIADQVADDRILELFADGNTLVLQGLHRLWPPLIDFAAALRAEIAHPVQVNAYLTPRSSQGFAHHYDVHDVFVLQIAGSKRWQVHSPVLTDPLRIQPWTDRKHAVEQASAGAPLLDTVLEPGDSLYLPRGYVHGAQALDGVSAHVTVGVHSITRYALAEALLAEAVSDAALRSSLPMGIDLGDRSAVTEEVQATITALTTWLERADSGLAADRLRRGVWPQNRPAPLSPISTAVALSGLNDSSEIALRPYLDLAWHSTGDAIRVETPTTTLTLSSAAAPVLGDLRAGRNVQVKAIGGLAPDSALDLARTLVRAGIAVPL